MKVATLIAAVTFTFPPSAFAAESAPTTTEYTAAILDSEAKWIRALYELDTTTLNMLHAPEYRLVMPGGVVEGDIFVKNVTARYAASNNALAIGKRPYRVTEQVVQLRGNVGIVVERCDVDNSQRGAGVLSGQFVVSNVWFQDGQSWRLALTHISRIEHGM